MKIQFAILFTSLFVLFCTSVYSQEISLKEPTDRKFLIGDKITIVSIHSADEASKLLKSTLDLLIDGENIKHTKYKIYETEIQWELGIPVKNIFIGGNKKIQVHNGENNQKYFNLNIYSNEPEQLNYDPKLQNLFYTFLQMGATWLIDSFAGKYSVINKSKPSRAMVDKVEIMTIGWALAGSR
ncbi:MAG TPA: hypothetical protein PK904_07315 [Bacteroidales bacterium]|nr:hypothetical protein [Bacteroidales bacterium]